MKHVWYTCDFCGKKVDDAAQLVTKDVEKDICPECWVYMMDFLSKRKEKE